jgi:cell wall-associated NlpC family hydrolase
VPVAAGATTVVGAATEHKGKKWVWGGGSVDGPTHEGFDSAGLVYYAVAQGTGGKQVLPRTADEQWDVGKEVPLAEVVAGDLIFSGWDRHQRPSHVGIAVGNGQMIHADPARGVVVADFYPESKARRVS